MPATPALPPQPSTDSDLSPEIRALMGVYALHTQVQAAIEEFTLLNDLSDQARHLLVLLETPQRLGDLARMSNCLPSTLTSLADMLEAKGLAYRSRDERDRRAWILSLTADGTALRSEMLQKASALFQNISGLNDAQTRSFANLSDIIRNNIHDSTLQESSK